MKLRRLGSISADVMLTAAASCFSTRWSRVVFFLLCSPLLLPILCVGITLFRAVEIFRLLCAVEIFSRLRSQIVKSASASFAVEVVTADLDDLQLQRCEEGCGEFGVEQNEKQESSLLQRYLEDQLILSRSGNDNSEDDGHCQNPYLH